VCKKRKIKWEIDSIQEKGEDSRAGNRFGEKGCGRKKVDVRSERGTWVLEIRSWGPGREGPSYFLNKRSRRLKGGTGGVRLPVGRGEESRCGEKKKRHEGITAE